MSISNVISSPRKKMVKSRKAYIFERTVIEASTHSATPIILGQTIDEGIVAFLTSKADKAPKTQVFYAERSKPFKAWCAGEGITHCDHVTPGVLDRYKAHRIKQNVSPDTLRSDLLTAVGVVKYDHQNHPDPDHRFKLHDYKLPAASKSQPPAANEGDLLKVLRAIKTAWSERGGYKLHRSLALRRFLRLRDITIVAILMDTGLRPTALFSLLVKAVHLGDLPYIEIEEGQGLKNKKGSIHPLSPEACDWLTKYLNVRGGYGPDDLLFTTVFGDAVDAHSFLNAFKRYAALAGVAMNLKMIRHYFATKIANTDNDGLLTAQGLMVHGAVTTTMRYVHKNPEKHRPQHSAAAPFAAVDAALRDDDEPSGRKSNRGRRVTVIRS